MIIRQQKFYELTTQNDSIVLGPCQMGWFIGLPDIDAGFHVTMLSHLMKEDFDDFMDPFQAALVYEDILRAVSLLGLNGGDERWQRKAKKKKSLNSCEIP